MNNWWYPVHPYFGPAPVLQQRAGLRTDQGDILGRPRKERKGPPPPPNGEGEGGLIDKAVALHPEPLQGERPPPVLLRIAGRVLKLVPLPIPLDPPEERPK
jgi:hypothetical protein